MSQKGFYIYEFMLAPGLKLKGCALLLYALIYSYTINGLEMFEGMESLAKRFNYTREFVGKSLRELSEAGLIIRCEHRHQPGNTYSYVANLSDPRCEISSHPNVNKVHVSMRTKFTSAREESSHDNKRDRIEDNNVNIHGKKYSLFPNAKIPAPKGPDSGSCP